MADGLAARLQPDSTSNEIASCSSSALSGPESNQILQLPCTKGLNATQDSPIR